MNPPSGPGSTLTIPDGGQRDELAEFTARLVQLDPGSLVRLRAADQRVVAWATTPFEVLATRAVRGELAPADLTVPAGELLGVLAVVRRARIDLGSGAAAALWRAELPPGHGWRWVAELPAAELAARAEAGLAEARDSVVVPAQRAAGPPLPPADLLDRAGGTVHVDGREVPIPLRCLFALSGLGVLNGGEGPVRVEVTEDGGWLRLEVAGRAVVRRRRVLLPLV
jgi:hypothetical protein